MNYYGLVMIQGTGNICNYKEKNGKMLVVMVLETPKA